METDRCQPDSKSIELRDRLCQPRFLEQCIDFLSNQGFQAVCEFRAYPMRKTTDESEDSARHYFWSGVISEVIFAGQGQSLRIPENIFEIVEAMLAKRG